jgi:hypothetical protein
MSLDLRFRDIFVKKQSLHQIMNEMATRLETLQPATPEKRSLVPLSELEAFLQMDSLLASLNKDYLDAKAQRIELIALYGNEDAMVEVAMDMEDSSWCAMQTRYIELREERELVERAQRMMRRVEEKIEQEKARNKAYEAEQFTYYMRAVQKMKEMNKNPKVFEIGFALMLLFKMYPLNYTPNNMMPRNGMAA